MYTQPDGYSCGVHSLINAFEALNGSSGIQGLASSINSSEVVYGKSRKEAIRSLRKAIGKIAGTTSKNGTSLAGMKRAVKYFGYVPTRYTSRDPLNAWRWIIKWSPYTPIILCVDRDQHYSTVTGYMNNMVVLVDPDPATEYGESGTYMLDKQSLLDRWISHKGLFRAIRVSRS